MIRYFIRSTGAHLRQAPSLFLLTVCGVALGVASVLAIQIINRNAIGAFSAGIQAISGEADLSVVGRATAFDESLFPRVLGMEGVAAGERGSPLAAPVRGVARVPFAWLGSRWEQAPSMEPVTLPGFD